MKEITLYHNRTPGRSDSFIVAIGYKGDLVFSEGSYYPPLDGSESREVDEYVTVSAAHKPDCLARLREACTALGLVTDSPGDADDDLLRLVQTLYQGGLWQNIESVKEWLTRQEIPFEEMRWFEID
jgi:hypothetical protein